jgi:aminomethyltransferase
VSTLLRTPLFENVKAAGARFVPFGGWEMPVQFQGIQAEHDHVRTAAGLFDVSHMGEIEIKGPGALEAVNRLITNDLAAIVDGQALYTCLCRPDGGIVDDLVVYRFAEDHIFICCNASNRAKDFAWIQENLRGVTARDRSDEFAQLALQGPKAVEVVQRFASIDLAPIKRYHFAVGQVCGADVIFSRTGYTGEDGFELYLSPADAPRVFDALIGEPEVKPIGLGARDTLRLEMKYALYGNDIDDTTTPLEAGLGWVVKLDKADFIGRDALVAQKAAGLTRRLVGFEMVGRAPARHDYPVVDAAGATVGRVTSGSFSPTLKKNIGLAYVPVGQDKLGSALNVQIRDRAEPAVVVKTPFVVR